MVPRVLALALALAVSPVVTGAQQQDPFLGDWQGEWATEAPGQPPGTGTAPAAAGRRLVAQVIPRGEGNYQINLLPAFDERGTAHAVVQAKVEGDRLRFDQGGWTGELHGERFKGTGTRGGEQAAFEMAKVTRLSPRLGEKPPKDATVLFDGTNFDHWEANRGDPAAITWQLAGGCARVWPPLKEHAFGTAIRTKKAFPNFRLHLEFRLPLMAGDTGQTRANSGVIIEEFEFYEVQILDSYGLAGDDHECGSIYGKAAPKVHLCGPPLVWQSYDITYRGPRFDPSGNLVAKARITVDHNGKVIHEDLELPFSERAVTARRQRPDSRTPGRITLQHHGDPVEFRNIWIIELGAQTP